MNGHLPDPVPVVRAIRDGVERLAAAGIDGARREARAILAYALGRPLAVVPAETEAGLPDEAFDALVARRVAGEPLALITGRREFWGLEFAVTPDTLIPRPDSETLIEATLAAFPPPKYPRHVLDLGTGTGCLLLAALHEFPAAFGVGVDLVPAAAALGRRNAASLGLAARAAFLCGDWAAALGGRFDLVLCNPPYIPGANIATLMREVGAYEPMSALAGGPDGLDAYRSVILRLPSLLTSCGVAILELGTGRLADVAALAAAQGLVTSHRNDFANVERALELRLPSAGRPPVQTQGDKKRFGSKCHGR